MLVCLFAYRDVRVPVCVCVCLFVCVCTSVCVFVRECGEGVCVCWWVSHLIIPL